MESQYALKTKKKTKKTADHSDQTSPFLYRRLREPCRHAETEMSTLSINAPKALNRCGLMGQSGTLETTNPLITADPIAVVCTKHNAGMYYISWAVSHHHCTQLAQREECHFS